MRGTAKQAAAARARARHVIGCLLVILVGVVGCFTADPTPKSRRWRSILAISKPRAKTRLSPLSLVNRSFYFASLRQPRIKICLDISFGRVNYLPQGMHLANFGMPDAIRKIILF